MDLLLNEIYKSRNLDFSQYKEKLIERRIAVRLRATKSNSYLEYSKILQKNSDEMDFLLNELTINVTRFFRDFSVFKVIQEKIIPKIIREHEFIKIWSCACSGGQEAVSILILFLEYIETLKKQNQLQGIPQIQIYGTDIDKLVIEKAEEGVYEDYEFQEMPKEYQAKYFIDMGNKKFWLKKEYRKYFTFCLHDIIKEPPLKNISFLLCRNLFIYFKPELQKICIEKFAQALRKNGFFITGTTEILAGKNLAGFYEYDQKNRIFLKF
ncbi:MAG: protein-glutamate O-methyltransferase CheR [Candidatus Margulisiibacteriota bacterium]|jgi:chemotaxis protein methyltransferase CheR